MVSGFHTYRSYLQLECFVWCFLDPVIIYSPETNMNLESQPILEKKCHMNQTSIVRFKMLVLGGSNLFLWVTKVSSNKVTKKWFEELLLLLLFFFFRGPKKMVKQKKSFLKDLAQFILSIWKNAQLMVNWWFGARWFGFLGSPKMKGICFIYGYPIRIPNHQPKPSINR